MASDKRKKALENIRHNIEKSGRHIYALMGGESPRYLYTIGLHEKRGFELVLPGLTTLPPQSCGRVLNQMAVELEAGGDPRSYSFEYQGITFTLSPVHSSWVEKLLLGALDYYREDIKAWQVVPDEAHGTIDIPNMTFPYSTETNPVWRWLDGGWPYALASDAPVIVDAPVLQGCPVAQVVHHLEGEWEMLSPSDEELTPDNLFLAPIATLVAFDPSLEVVLDLPAGAGLYRETPDGPWRRWTPSHS